MPFIEDIFNVIPVERNIISAFIKPGKTDNDFRSQIDSHSVFEAPAVPVILQVKSQLVVIVQQYPIGYENILCSIHETERHISANISHGDKRCSFLFVQTSYKRR